MVALNKVAVLCGGISAEHPVSLKSGATMIKSLGRAGFDVTPVVIGKDGTWSIIPGKGFEADVLGREVEGKHPKATVFGTPLAVALELVLLEIQVVVIGLHGPGGEDGSIQGFLQTAGLAYTGPDVPTSAVAMDKVLLKHVLRSAKLPTADWLDLGDPADEASLLAAIEAAAAWATKAGYPVVVKARTLGSSFGVGIAADRDGLEEVIRKIAPHKAGLFVEKAIQGTEVSCAVVGKGAAATALPAVEIVPRKNAWFDFESKYESGGALERIPAKIPAKAELEVRRLALAVHGLLRADGVTRTDMIIDGSGPKILETNTLPGMTETSLVPQEAAAIGWSLETLLTNLVESAWRRRHPEEAAYNQGDEPVPVQPDPDHRSRPRAGQPARGGRRPRGAAGGRDDDRRPRARSRRR
jgi:D-alanine-D-alanine ligase